MAFEAWGTAGRTLRFHPRIEWRILFHTVEVHVEIATLSLVYIRFDPYYKSIANESSAFFFSKNKACVPPQLPRELKVDAHSGTGDEPACDAESNS